MSSFKCDWVCKLLKCQQNVTLGNICKKKKENSKNLTPEASDILHHRYLYTKFIKRRSQNTAFQLIAYKKFGNVSAFR